MSSLSELLEDKTSPKQVLAILQDHARVQRRDLLDELRSVHRDDISSLADVAAVVEQKANASDVKVHLGRKVDLDQFQSAMQTIVQKSELDARLKANTEAIASEVKQALMSSHQEIVKILNQKVRSRTR